MSCFLLYLGTDRRFEELLHHTLLVGRGYRDFIRDVTRRGRLPRRSRPTSTRPRAPSRRWRRPAATRSRAAPGPEPARRGSTGSARGPAARRARRRPRDDLRPGRAATPRPGRAPHDAADFERELGAVDGNAFAIEPTLHQSAYLRPPNRDRGVARPVPRRRRDAPRRRHPRRAARRRGDGRADRRPTTRAAAGGGRADGAPTSLAEARATTRRVARTFALACRLLPRDVRDDVYLLYLVFRTLDDLVDEDEPGAAARVAAVEAWARGRAGDRTPRGRGAGRARRASPAAARGAARLLRRDALGPRGRRRSRPRPTSTATATASPARSAS